MIKKLALSLLLSSVAVLGARAATDNYESGTIALGTYNGGSGFGALTALGGGGGVYASNAGTDGRQIDDSQSLGIYGGGAGEAVGRSLTSSVTQGSYSVDARFDLNNATDPFTGINIKSSLGAAFGTGELLSIGLVANQNGQFLVTDGGGAHNLSIGTDTELRGNAFNFTINFNTVANTYSMTVTDKVTSQVGTISGSLEGAGAVAAIGFQNGDTEGGNQNFIVDNTTVTAVPEPATVLLVGPALLGGMFFVRRRRA